ncbi:peptide chain release factor N(5)-glutamine methyltransferase [Vallitalea pronyensis]|uniref:Release factor glutamine methyltransferase n=1 Tax=Vallitalea pronyensis TaxID=1348613 RepID=A0A8J8MI84_9FIRM|nr:peptide chain release factor N(5)-glutamine methyltransferase [Vallitalea pronyensis]QUI21931.1 peptide chain release factor N(5)-glutamine methyltransferase [Vallitalea pronyensis]
MKKTIRYVLSEGIKTLQDNHITHAKIDATLLLEHLLDIDRVYVIIHDDEVITEQAYKLYRHGIMLRAKGKPLQYIIGHVAFMGLNFTVNEHVLIPRQDTEILVEEAITCIQKNKVTHILEIGTGSGCIPISLCHACPTIKVTTVDISKEAIEVAKENARQHGVEDRIAFIHSDLLQQVDKTKRYELIISNPPYIKREDIQGLMREVKDHEPMRALDGGMDGLDFYRRISTDVMEVASHRCYIFYEVGHNQSIEVKDILEERGYTHVKIIKDLAGINRVVTGEKYQSKTNRI